MSFMFSDPFAPTHGQAAGEKMQLLPKKYLPRLKHRAEIEKHYGSFVIDSLNIWKGRNEYGEALAVNPKDELYKEFQARAYINESGVQIELGYLFFFNSYWRDLIARAFPKKSNLYVADILNKHVLHRFAMLGYKMENGNNDELIMTLGSYGELYELRGHHCYLFWRRDYVVGIYEQYKCPLDIVFECLLKFIMPLANGSRKLAEGSLSETVTEASDEIVGYLSFRSRGYMPL